MFAGWSAIIVVLSVSHAAQGALDIFNRGIFSSPLEIDPKIAEDARLTTPELVAKYNYNSEAHTVTTEDGYILEMHRVSGGPKSPPQKGKKVVFLMHGLFALSKQFVATGPDHAQAFQLADEGYDVWMGNSRGTDYSLNHTTYNAFGDKNEQEKYWSFSFHEIGVYDLPAMIDYVLEQTGQQKLQYVGHSQGCTVYFVMISEKPEMNEKIIMMNAMAPAVFITHIRNPIITTLTPYINAIKVANQLTRVYYVPMLQKLIEICRDVKLAAKLCERTLSEMMGHPTNQTDLTMIPVIYSLFASQTSADQFFHFFQSVRSGEFRKYNFGEKENLKRYGQPLPPPYKLENADVPVAVYYGENDWFVAPPDARKLVSKLPNVVLDYLVPNKEFNHGDFSYGVDARRLVLNKVLEMMRSAEANE